MSLSSAVLDALLANGATAEMIVAAVKADAASDEARREAKRAGSRERQARKRAKDRENHAVSHDVTPVTRDIPETKVSPTPPSKTQTLEFTPPIVPPAKCGGDGVVEAKPATSRRQPVDEIAMASDVEFREFWNIGTELMRRRGKSQATVYAEWKIHRQRQPPAMLNAALRRYVAEDADVKRGMGQPGLQRWLKDRVYEQWLRGGEGVLGVSDDRWRMMVEYFRDGTPWGASMGPAPGEAGCCVPPPILAEFGYAIGEAA